MKKHIENLRKLFPNSFIRPSEDFGTGGTGAIWTGFGEDGTYDYDSTYTDPKLQKYLDKHNLYIEPYDAGTMFICRG